MPVLWPATGGASSEPKASVRKCLESTRSQRPSHRRTGPEFPAVISGSVLTCINLTTEPGHLQGDSGAMNSTSEENSELRTLLALAHEGDQRAFNELIEKAAVNSEEAERSKLYGEAQKILANDVPALYLFDLPRLNIWSKKLEGLWENEPISQVYVRDAYWAE